MDALATEMKKARENNAAMKVKGLDEIISEHAGFQSFAKKSNKTSGEILVKAVGDMVLGTQVAAGAARGLIAPGITPVAREMMNIRDLFSVIPGTAATYAFMRETGVEGAPTTVAQGATKPQTDNDIELVELTYRKIAHHKRISEELLNDIPALSGFLTTYGVAELMKVEDAQLLSGAGTGTDLTGLSVNALTDANVTAGFLDKYALNGSNKWDQLFAAIAAVATGKHTVNRIILNPSDWYAALSDKTSDGHYPYNSIMYNGGQPIFFGIPVSLSTSVAAGTMYLGDTNAAQIVQRDGISVRFYDQDQDNPIKNLVTVVIEERLQFPIYYPTAWFVETFANMKLAVEAAS